MVCLTVARVCSQIDTHLLPAVAYDGALEFTVPAVPVEQDDVGAAMFVGR